MCVCTCVRVHVRLLCVYHVCACVSACVFAICVCVCVCESLCVRVYVDEWQAQTLAISEVQWTLCRFEAKLPPWNYRNYPHRKVTTTSSAIPIATRYPGRCLIDNTCRQQLVITMASLLMSSPSISGVGNLGQGSRIPFWVCFLFAYLFIYARFSPFLFLF